jgi:hypothetical protein
MALLSLLKCVFIGRRLWAPFFLLAKKCAVLRLPFIDGEKASIGAPVFQVI